MFIYLEEMITRDWSTYLGQMSHKTNEKASDDVVDNAAIKVIQEGELS